MSTNPPLIHLRSRRLTVDIARPGTRYRGARFDWSSFITQVTLDDTHTFCGTEAPSGSDGGVGLCCEFGSTAAVAFPQAEPGERFVKPGVGLLTRPDAAPYSFAARYAVEPFEICTETAAESVTFTIQPRICNGYAMRLIRRIAVDSNRLQVSVLLQNTGAQPIITDEYCHNFIAIDGRGPGPGFSFRTGFSFSLEQARHILHVQPDAARWERCPERPFYLPGGRVQRSPGTYWLLKHEPSGVGVAESGSFPLGRFALWGCGHVVSPEAFVAIHVRPGESQYWHRDYTYFRPGDAEPSVTVEESRPCEPQLSPVSLPHSGSRRTSPPVSAR